MENKRFDPKNSDKLMNQARRDRLQPEKIMQHLDLKTEDNAVDLGAGPGLFTIPLAKQINGEVYAVDVEPAMLEKLKTNAEQEGVHGITYITSDLETLPLSDQSVTKVLNTFVIHEVDSAENAIREMNRILEPGGILLLVDWARIETESGPPLEQRFEADDMAERIQKNGFETEVMRPNPDENFAIKAVKTASC
ncbi:class I SAM-dependent methyltransferase [Lentibacillus kimchii]|uniref:Class I SAM-dependent methyltransferase n=1 Tax=Lentibacillus kimchii TaxID=1542911 RepID=A0ABW2UQG3_9BACI